MAYVSAADLGLKSKKSWAQGFLLSEADGDAAYIATVIADVEARVNLLLDDDFTPEPGDADEVVLLSGSGAGRLYLPRRCRSITTLETQSTAGAFTTQAATTWRLHSSLNAAGTAMVTGSGLDWVDVITTLSTGVFPWGWQSVRVTGKFGWAACPNDIKRLVAMLVYDDIKPQNQILHKVEQQRTETTNYTFVVPDDADAPFGIPKADAIYRAYRRNPVMVA